MKVEVGKDIMALNNEQAAENRCLLAEKKVCCVNILGSPGAGKTTLLERLAPLLAEKLQLAVIEGDLATARDASRIAELGVSVVQINTDGGCHLDAKMIARVLPAFDLEQTDLLLIENVGNLVCPASFDLGEDSRWVVLSLAEGADKPAKYPGTFLSADTVILNKMDLAPYIDSDIQAEKADIFAIRPGMRVIETVCRAGYASGLEEVAAELMRLVAAKQGQA